VFDRIRENLRKYRRDLLPNIINSSVNETLGRTIRTSGTTLLAVISLLIFGGDVILNFNVAMFFGVVIGTFSSIYVAAALLLYMPALKALRPAAEGRDGEAPSKAAG
jgi:preprotein translocase SecF subunit